MNTNVNFPLSVLDSHLDDMDADHSHYKPEAIDTLCQLTKFNKRELQLMYRGFKQVRPLCINSKIQ